MAPPHDEGMVVLIISLLLSPSILAGPSIGTPNIRRASRYSTMSSILIRVATISEEYVNISTVFWHLLTQRIGIPFMKRRIPVTERRVT
jgi:hypothetical protein